jgi:hypothetical protein
MALAREMKVIRIGGVAIDGSKLEAIAAKRQVTPNTTSSPNSEPWQRAKEFREGMKACVRSGIGRASQTLRSTTVEPVFSWIKNPWFPPLPNAGLGRSASGMEAHVPSPQPRAAGPRHASAEPAKSA